MTFGAVAATKSGGQWLSITPSGGVAPQVITVVVTPTGLTEGTYEGTVSLTPLNSQTAATVVTVTLTVTKPGPQISAVVNGASFAPGAVAPGEIVTIFGANLGPQALVTHQLTPAGMIDWLLSGVRVWFEDQPAPILHASATQVTVVAPYSIESRQTLRVRLEYNGVTSAVTEVPVVPAAPGLFTAGGTQEGAILNQDSSVNTAQNPAAPGTVISLFATGEGQTNPAGVEGKIIPVDDLAKPVQLVRVTIGGRDAAVAYAGSAPTMPAGLMQVNATIPADTPAGAVPVVLYVGDTPSQSGVTVHIAAP
jgi:uncharacterized protein (TIGR03437 family)